MGHPGAAERTRNGFSRVQKGRCYMKPILGDFYNAGDKNPYHCYQTTDFRDRLVSQPSVYGDIETLKSVGHVVPNLEDVVFNDYLVTRPWTALTDNQYLTKVKKGRGSGGSSSTGTDKVKGRASSGSLGSDKKDRKGRSIFSEPYVPKNPQPMDASALWQKKAKDEFRLCISRMNYSAVFGTYLKVVKKKPKLTRIHHAKKSLQRVELEDKGSEFERALIRDAKKSVTNIKGFTARKVPWKSFLQPASLSKIATSATSMKSGIQEGNAILESSSDEDDDDDYDDDSDDEIIIIPSLTASRVSGRSPASSDSIRSRYGGRAENYI